MPILRLDDQDQGKTFNVLMLYVQQSNSASNPKESGQLLVPQYILHSVLLSQSPSLASQGSLLEQ